MHGPLIDFRYDGQNTDWTVILFVQNSGGSRGGSGGSNEPPLEPKLFHFHGEFQEKLVKLHKSNPLSKFEPPIQKSWIRPCKGSFFLWRGTTCAPFKLARNWHLRKVILIRLATVPCIELVHDLIIFADILSTPVDFLGSIFDKIFITSESETGRNENFSVLGCKFSDIIWMLGCSLRFVIWQSLPIFLSIFAKNVLKTVQTSAWSEITWSFSFRITSDPPSDPFFDRKGLIVGQKSLDFGPPAPLS